MSLLPLLQYGRTPLHLAANNGSLEVVRHLCLAGANTEAVTHVSHRAASCLFFFSFFFLPILPQDITASCPSVAADGSKRSRFECNEVQ